MTVRLKLTAPDGSKIEVETDTIDDAIEYQQKWFSIGGAPRLRKTNQAVRPAKTPNVEELSREGMTLIALLEMSPDGIETGRVTEELGLAEGYALGPVISEVYQWGAKYGLEPHEIVTKKRKRNRTSKKIERFYFAGEAIKDGRVAVAGLVKGGEDET